MIKLEEICGYMPYGLKCMTNLKKGNNENWGKLLVYGLTSEHALFYPDGDEECAELFEDIKPILRPLSDLTREIEHNGEKFVPYKILEKEFLMEGLLEFKEHKFGWVGFTDNKTNNIPIYMDGVIMPECGYGIVKKLYEWHFDLFGLIERKEAIDINTLK